MTATPLQTDAYDDWQLLARGSQSDTWRARDRILDVPRIIKVRTGDGAALAIIRRHALALSRISHPNLQPLLSVLTEGDRLALVHAFVPGPTLRETLATQGPLPMTAALAAIAQILGALAALHAEHLVYRDLSPENIVLSPRQGAVLIDFDVIEELSESSSLGRTTIGRDIAGTPLYMAPEQLLGAPQSAAVDVWAAGAVLYEAVTGKSLRRAASYRDLRAEALADIPADLGRDHPALQSLLADLLAPDPAARPTAADAARAATTLRDRIAAASTGSVEISASAPASPVGQTQRVPNATPELHDGNSFHSHEARSRSPALPWVLLAVALAGLAGAALVLFRSPLPQAPGAPGGGVVPDATQLLPFALLAGGLVLIALGVLATQRLRARTARKDARPPDDFLGAITAVDGRAQIGRTIAIGIEDFRRAAGPRADHIISVSMVALAREYAEATTAEDRFKALSMLNDLHGKVARQMRPWWQDYETLVARGLSLCSLLAGAAAAIEGLRRLL